MLYLRRVFAESSGASIYENNLCVVNYQRNNIEAACARSASACIMSVALNAEASICKSRNGIKQKCAAETFAANMAI